MHIFYRIWTEYGEIRSISLYSVRMRENTDQKNSEYRHFLRVDTCRVVKKFCSAQCSPFKPLFAELIFLLEISICKAMEFFWNVQTFFKHYIDGLFMN